MENARKTTAAAAAVLLYIKTEEEVIAMQSAMQAAQPQLSKFAPQTAPVVKSWGISGRQAQMQMRHLMQLRTFRKL
ncbi:MAG: hypothetical protein PVI71_16390 [Desulfobacterales bacterium]|jgi:hypothetical protein